MKAGEMNQLSPFPTAPPQDEDTRTSATNSLRSYARPIDHSGSIA
jgi:hypothetical protein